MVMSREDVLSSQVRAAVEAWQLDGRFRGVAFHVGNEHSASFPSQIARIKFYQKRKAIGFVNGAPDWVFFWPGADLITCGGMIELKTEQGYIPSPKTGKVIKDPKAPGGELNPEQKDFRDECRAFALHYAVCRTVGNVEAMLTQWGALKAKNFYPSYKNLVSNLASSLKAAS